MAKVDSYDVVDCQEFPYLPASPSRWKFRGSGAFVITWHEYWESTGTSILPRTLQLKGAIERNLLKLTEKSLAVFLHTAQAEDVKKVEFWSRSQRDRF